MARGPAPKPAATRRRRNKTSTAATLSAGAIAYPAGTPELPKRGRRKWHERTVAWWLDIWASPMAPEFLNADVHALYLLAEMLNRFWTRPSANLAKEIRQHQALFGLTPLDRRRLQWEIARADDATAKTEKRRPAAQRPDVRRLYAVK